MFRRRRPKVVFTLRRRPKEVAFTEPNPNVVQRREVISGLIATRGNVPEPLRSHMHVLVMEHAQLADQFEGCIDKLRTARRQRDVALSENAELVAALRRLDHEVGEAISAEAAGEEVSLHRLDEVRGSIWASYTAASAALKA